ncbi:hypothetical protein GW916_15440 [bacterium]|nr:hypothetical protein [bacterium]
MNFNSKIVFTLISIALLATSCTQPDSEVSQDEGASFYVSEVDLETAQTQMKEANGWRTPVSIRYTIKACIEDRAERRDAIGHRFTIRTPEGVVFDPISPNTDTNGCLRWVEPIEFDYFANEILYVPIEREIVGTGIYAGSRKIEFAINPWTVGEAARGKGKNFILLNDGQKVVNVLTEERLVPKLYAQAALKGEYSREQKKTYSALNADQMNKIKRSSTSRIWVDRLSYTPVKRRALNGSLVLDVSLTMEPKLIVTNADGQLEPMSINRGEFEIIAHLVYTDTGADEDTKMNIKPQGDGNHIITDPRGFHGKGAADNGKLVSQLRINWERRAQTGNVTVALKVIPKGLSNVAPFEGLFELSGGATALTKKTSADLLPGCDHPTDVEPDQTGFNTSYSSCQEIAPFLKNTDNYEKLKKQGFASRPDAYFFDRFKLRFVSVLPGETATQRVVLYSATTCLIDAFDGSRPRNIPFVVEYLSKDRNGITGSEKDAALVEKEAASGAKEKIVGEKGEIVETTSDGCLTWNSTVHHAYYGPEKFFRHMVRITNQKTDPKKRLDFKKSFYLNPWDDKFTFGWDEDEYNESYLSPKKAKSRFFMADFGYHTVRFLYNIDPYMELEVKKTVLLDLAPRVLRYAGIVNARKQTEPLRDGIYLMKVAIQKDFLDPTERAIDLREGEAPVSLAIGSRSSEAANFEVDAVINKSLGKVKKREYITTDMSLVRVVDGHLIHPIELTMRDLRLMRVRSNFLIQFETVDERKLQVHDVLNQKMKKEVAELRLELKNRRELEEKARQIRQDGNIKLTETLMEEHPTDEIVNRTLVDLEVLNANQRENTIRSKYVSAFYKMNQQLENMPFINSNFELDPALLEPVLDVLKVNDFTDVRLPSKSEADLNLFKEDSGLDARTFVGPVIFLSNAYSDSVRATDNLDEANCPVPAKSNEDLELLEEEKNQASLLEMEGINGIRKALVESRENKAYRYSRYYGALTHLCNKQVDDLLELEELYEEQYRQIMPLASSKANLVRTSALDYMSIANEPLMSLPADQCELDEGCRTLRSRVYSKEEIDLILQDALKVNSYAYYKKEELAELLSRGSNLSPILLPPLQYQQVEESGPTEVFRQDIADSKTIFTSCAVLSQLAVNRMEFMAKEDRTKDMLDGRMRLSSSKERYRRAMLERCVGLQTEDQSAIVLDDKLKVYDTGVDYVFRGGLQMNINVGTSVSFSRGENSGLSLKYDDIPAAGKGVVASSVGLYAGFQAYTTGAAVGSVAGGPIGALVGVGAAMIAGSVYDFGLALIKPLGASSSISQSNSEGTSVSDGTYLVSQMAKFDVPIKSYQRCRVIRFSDAFSEMFLKERSLNPDLKPYLSKGFMTCGEMTKIKEGEDSLRVPESYFYFTQHFTEGDMLDQADLYNHPWLLALRGVRDFGVFLDSIKGVEMGSILGTWNDLREGKPSRGNRVAWPLDHMAVTYRQLVPTFPGFYSLSTFKERVTTFPLKDRLSRLETDVNAEVKCTMVKNNSGLPTCQEKATITKGDGGAGGLETIVGPALLTE